jgi:nucleotide-binding universal stress UspA family protein
MYKHMLVPFDGSPLAEGVLEHTIAFAHVFAAQVTLLCMLAEPHLETLMAAFDGQLQQAEAEAALTRAVVQLQAAGVPTRVVKIAGQSASSVINYVRRHQVDLVILSRHSESGLLGGKLGASLQNLLQSSHIAGVIVRTDQPVPTGQTKRKYQRLLASCEGPPRAVDILPFVTTLARTSGTQLLLVHVLCRPRPAWLEPSLPLTKTSAERVLAHKNKAVARNLGQLDLLLTGVTANRLLEREAIAVHLHEIAEAEGIDLVILRAHCYAAGSEWPYGKAITNFIAYGATPLLMVQARLANWTPKLTDKSARAAGGQVFMTSECWPSTWLYG